MSGFAKAHSDVRPKNRKGGGGGGGGVISYLRYLLVPFPS